MVSLIYGEDPLPMLIPFLITGTIRYRYLA